MTGRLPVRSGMSGSMWTGGVFMNEAVGGLPANETTLAELVTPLGYRTMAIGKWHLGQRDEFLPTSHGFHEYFGIPYSVDMGDSPWYTNPYFPLTVPLMHNKTIVQQPADLSKLTELYAQKAAAFITDNLVAKTPWLLYLAWNHVHVPDFASQQFCNTSIRGRFGDALEEMDHYIGQVLDALHTAGGDENTVVFFTSDNGPWLIERWSGGSSGPFFEGKTTTWEGGVRVPGIIRWPGRVPAGAISHELVATYDIFTTVAGLAGASLPQGVVLDGRDLSQVMRGNASTRESRCMMIYKGVPSTGLPPRHDDPQPGLWAVRCGPYKAHFVSACAVMGALGDRRCGKGPFGAVEGCKGSECDDRILDAQTNAAVKHDPPLMFQLEKDPGELYPLSPKSEEYTHALAVILEAKAEHEATLTPVPNQIGMGNDKRYGQCCNRNSQEKYPDLPECTCDPDVWRDAFVCTPVDDSPTSPWTASVLPWIGSPHGEHVARAVV